MGCVLAGYSPLLQGSHREENLKPLVTPSTAQGSHTQRGEPETTGHPIHITGKSQREELVTTSTAKTEEK